MSTKKWKVWIEVESRTGEGEAEICETVYREQVGVEFDDEQDAVVAAALEYVGQWCKRYERQGSSSGPMTWKRIWPVLVVCDLLKAEAVPASYEYPGWISIVDAFERDWAIGTANPTWGADLVIDANQHFELHRLDEELSKIPSDTTDFKAVVKEILAMVKMTPWGSLQTEVKLALDDINGVAEQLKTDGLCNGGTEMLQQATSLIEASMRRYFQLTAPEVK